jgi:acyl-coenzyme A synthetase/AMP-(fatty) acid ligase
LKVERGLSLKPREVIPIDFARFLFNALTVADGLAQILHDHGIKLGDVVAVFMSNSPEMVFVLLALSKIGGIPALINTSLRST